jgi:hypothetical protein
VDGTKKRTNQSLGKSIHAILSKGAVLPDQAGKFPLSELGKASSTLSPGSLAAGEGRGLNPAEKELHLTYPAELKEDTLMAGLNPALPVVS